jgi:hypothetical protein
VFGLPTQVEPGTQLVVISNEALPEISVAHIVVENTLAGRREMLRCPGYTEICTS